ncbi:universal stress protein UspA [Halobiforma lacisalsi AJ5]|uniref:Universal stress protein UspA n=1 Tax=Natronobacterium lacisalsi AJ5 TaxID=358396 RepID=M0LYD1_NATLA|nr:universal stress protein [Halobiforma lacisalsi]APW97509.1 universal stress protein UspA [Halobiforma lacisalsi AJ5]EMA37110.1 UspA domain-containing protein [Halobiforma lacisalsi AJ5]
MYRHILVPTDGSDPATRAVEQGIELADRFDATLHVLFAADVDERTPLDLSGSQPVESVREHGRQLVEGVAERAPDSVAVTTSVEDGDPREVILEYIDDNAIDVAVMGTHGRRGIDRLLLGSVTEHVMRNADCSVLVTRADEHEEPVGDAAAAVDVAREALADAEGIDVADLDIEDDPHEMGGYWIVHAENDDRAFNVHISRATGTTRIAELRGE